MLVATLSLGNVLNAGFDQIYNMYNPLVYESIDIIDTFVYRIGLVDMQYGLSTAGLFKSVVSMVLIILPTGWPGNGPATGYSEKGRVNVVKSQRSPTAFSP